jgi:hypothetical protein
VVLALIIGSGCDGGTTDANAPTTCCLATPVTTEANRIEATALDVFGDAYAGLGLVDDDLVVFTAGTIPEVLAEVLEGVPVRRVYFNLGELEAFKARLDAVAEEAISRGVRLVAWGVDPTTMSVGVAVASDTTAAEAVLAELLGPDVPITVYAHGPVTT